MRFSDDQARVLDRVLDEIIPPSADGRLPGAGDLGLAGYVATALEKTPEVRDMVARGLSALDSFAAERTAQRFTALSRAAQSDVLHAFAESEHAFPPTLVLLAYTGYYAHERVVGALGLEPRPPHPQGYDMEPNDLTLLDPVRRRSKLYREC